MGDVSQTDADSSSQIWSLLTKNCRWDISSAVFSFLGRYYSIGVPKQCIVIVNGAVNLIGIIALATFLIFALD